MDEQLADILADLVMAHTDAESVDASSISLVPVDPMFHTYAVGDYWVKVMKADPKNPGWTPLHREQFALTTIIKLNKRTVEYKLHMPVTEPIHLEPVPEKLKKPCLIVKKITGQPLIKTLGTPSALDSAAIKKLGERIGCYMARVHATQIKGAGLLSPEMKGVHPGPWQKYFAAVSTAQWKHLQGSGVVDDSLLNRLANLTNDKMNLLIGEPVTLIHNDYTFSNIWEDPADNSLTGILNFAQSGAGSPLIDIASFYLHCFDANLWKEVKAGYEIIRSMPPNTEVKMAFYSSIFGMRAAWFYHQRGDEVSKNYYLNRALSEAAKVDKSFQTEASRYGGSNKPSYAAD